MQCCKNLRSEMRDGIELSLDLYTPDDRGTYPVILIRTPYTKDSLKRERIYGHYQRFTDRGYAIAVQDCRGTGESDGIFCANAPQEYEDGYDTVEWIAKQNWCNGNVGMMGLSYFCFTQLAAASLQPPALKAICPFMTMSQEMFGSWMTRSVNYGHIHWIYGQLLEHLGRYIPDAERRERYRILLETNNRNLDQFAYSLPATQNPAIISGVPLLNDYVQLYNGIEKSEYWRSMHHPTDFSCMHVPMFHCTGWFDVCLDTTIRNWKTMQSQSDSYTKEQSRLIIGPWAHGGECNTVFGHFDFGHENDGEGQDLSGKMLSWFDYYMKGKANGVEQWPIVHFYVLGLNRWLDSAAWPPAEADYISLYLHRNHQLSTDLPTEEEPDHYTYDPGKPSPAKAGDGELIPDYRPVSNRGDVICYETKSINKSVVLAGTVKMDLFASSDVKDTDFACRLMVVLQDGFEFMLSQGLVRAKWRNGGKTPTFLEKNQMVHYEFEIGNIACQLQKGQRLKIHVMSALFPLYDRNLNTGEPSATCDHYQIAHQSIFHDILYPSAIRLPVLPDA